MSAAEDSVRHMTKVYKRKRRLLVDIPDEALDERERRLKVHQAKLR